MLGEDDREAPGLRVQLLVAPGEQGVGQNARRAQLEAVAPHPQLVQVVRDPVVQLGVRPVRDPARPKASFAIDTPAAMKPQLRDAHPVDEAREVDARRLDEACLNLILLGSHDSQVVRVVQPLIGQPLRERLGNAVAGGHALELRHPDLGGYGRASGVTARADPSKDALEPDGFGADPAHSPGKCTLLTMLAATPSLPSPGPDRRTH